MRTLKACCWIFGCLGSVGAALDLVDVTLYGRVVDLPSQQVVASDRVIGAILAVCLLAFLLGVAIPEGRPAVEDLVAELLDDPWCAMCNDTGRMDCYECQGRGVVRTGLPCGVARRCGVCDGAGQLRCTGFKHARAARSALRP